MALHFHRTPIVLSATTLKTLVSRYREYTKQVEYSAIDEETYQKCRSATALLQSSIRQIKEARENLQELYNEVRDEYKNCKNKSERKDLMIEIEQIEEESQLQSAIAEANDLTFMLTARLDETKNMRENMEIKLGYMSLKPQRDNNVNNEENEEGDGEIDNTNENCVRDTTMPSCSQDTSNSASTCNSGTAKRTLRSIKPPQATLPKFYGNSDDFPEYWAIFEALVHNSEELDIMEKILLLKESLKGRAQTAIKGIKLIPENYNWLIKTLQENYSNHQCNRSQIVKKLVSMSVANNSADICSATFDQIRMLTNQMISAGYHVGKTCDPMWCETILSKFPEDIIKSVLVASQSQDRQTVDDLMNLLKTEITAKAYVESRLGHKHINKAIPSKTNHDNLRTNRNCLFCHKDNHVSMQCRTVTDQSIRRKMLKEQNRCWKCCSPNHSSFDCQRSDCLKCGQKHHMSLCFKTEQLSQNNSSKPKFVRVGQNQQRQHSWQNREENNRNIPQRFKPINTQVSVEPPQIKENSIQHSQTSKQLILMTAEGNIWNARKQTYEKVLFFFDSGAQKTVIEENLAQQLGLPKNTTEICTMSGIGGHIECFESHKVPVKLGTAFGEEICMTIQTKPVITNGFPSVKLNTEDIEFLKTNTICLANSKLRGEHQNPHILVGLDYYHDLVTDPANGIRTPSGFHIAKTVFGPTIYGRGISKVSETANTVCHSLTGISENTEQELLQKMFELDGLGIMPEETQGDEKVQRYFEEYSKLISFENNIITAPFPLKENVIQLENNYSVAIRRLESLQNILLCNPEQKQWYCDLVNKYVSEGIVETFDTADRYAAGIYYMPHTGVWKPQKKVPLRIVFDASSKRRGHLSLNDVIRKGESFVNRIHDILTSSRFTKIVLMCDIESAFTQIRLVDAHKDLCRFLWLRNVNHPPTKDNVVEYRFRRLPFGVTACPSILNMAILSYLESQNSELSTEIAENLYVDNILLQAESVPEAVRKYKESKYLFSKIGMNLREYISNSEEVNSRIPYSDKLQSGSMKILGVDYNTITDNFTVRTKFVHNKKLTKRDVVSQINSIYDPIGLTGPLMVKLKSMMREIFDSKVDWKTPLDQKICDEWYKLCKEVDLATLSIPRYVLSPRVGDQKRLWLFADASRIAIAACSYLQCVPSGTISGLICGRTRLTPKKLHQTIPKLELLGILIAARLGCSILSAVQAKIEEVNIVSDSEIALYWIKSSKKVPVFVANQRAKILSIKQQLDNRGATVKFFHVSTENNPADAGTRGLTAQEIIENDWIKGPRWLENHCSEWPIKSINTLSDVHENDEIETMVTTTLKVTTSENKQQEQLIDLKRFSKIDNVLRVLAKTTKTMKNWVAKTNQNRSSPIKVSEVDKFDNVFEITASDMVNAERLLISHEHRSINLDALKKRFHDKLIIRDEDGIIRHHSRLQNASIPYDTKSPIYIPEDSELSRLIVQDIHIKNGHSGKEHTLSIARQRFWISRPSYVFKKFIKGCVICKKYQGLPLGAPIMPPLPKDRVIKSRPFQNVGCDFMGPFTSKTLEKMYVCLYTCLTTRALHLEVVENLSAGAFLNCFVRFVSRRGVPEIVRSDCGTNFKLGEVIITKMFCDLNENGRSLMSYCASQRINWIFNPPGSPWMGGAWERLVGLTKKAFNKSIGRKRLSFADMCTVITRIEAILNTRPLTKLNSSDIAEIPLRPIDFLKGNFNYSLPNDKVANVSGDPDYDPNLIQTEKQALEAFQTSEMIANKFWEKWNVEYLTSLRETQKINLKQPRHLPRSLPEIGEIVLIEEELIPRGCWSYGRITEIIYSADGSVRSAKVLLPNRKIIHRPLNKIFPLEIRSAPEDTTINTQKDQHQPNQERRKLPARASKTEAYEIIRDYELGLEGAQYTIPRTPLALTIIAMLSMISPTLAECVPKIACVKGKINISPPKGSFQLCFDEHCRTFNEVTKNLTYTVPISPHNDQVKVALIMIGNHSMETLETTCNRPDFCDHHYFLSKALLGNPHCWPAGAIATLAVVIYIFAVILAILVWSMYKLRHANKAVPMEQLPMITTRHNRSNSPNAFVPAPLPCLTAICLILTTVLTSANACQRGYMRHSANLICNEQSKCFYQYNEELLFNRLTSKICIQINHSNKTLGFIRVTKKPIKLTCSKVLEFFTRETEVRVYHVERCAQAGSCVDNKCHTMPSNETVHELRKYKRYPGYSGCISICGGIPCGCLLPLPACQFYRVVNRPTSRSIYEVIRCADWTASMELEIEVILMGKNTKKSLSMRPYVTEIVERVDITVISLQKPTITAINQRYAISENAAFILPDRFVVPVECSDEVQAQTQFSTCTNRIRCHCENAHRCQCPEESLSHLRNSSALPIETPSYNLTKEDDSVMTITEEGEFVLTLDSKILVNASEIVTKKKCEIQTIDLTGCYNCEHGARLVTRCRSQLDIRVTVVCKTFEFVIHCGPMNVNKTTLLAFDHAIVRETCTTDCSENVDIKGVLSYHIGLNTAVFEASDHYVQSGQMRHRYTIASSAPSPRQS